MLPKGLPLPHKVTCIGARHSKKVLRIERLLGPKAIRCSSARPGLVHYSTMVPGFSFLALGFLHLQGNQTKALTSIVRLLIDLDDVALLLPRRREDQGSADPKPTRSTLAQANGRTSACRPGWMTSTKC